MVAVSVREYWLCIDCFGALQEVLEKYHLAQQVVECIEHKPNICLTNQHEDRYVNTKQVKAQKVASLEKKGAQKDHNHRSL